MNNGKTNWVAIWISAAVVVLLVAVGGLVVWMNNQATAPGDAPQASYIDAETGAIAIGEGDDVISEYVDFACPHCAEYEEFYGPTTTELIDSGEVTLHLHPISILNRNSQGTEYSTRSAAATYCVAEQDVDLTRDYAGLLFAGQQAGPLADEDLVALAEQVGAPDAADCITDGRYTKFVDAMTKKTPVAEGAQGISTPTILVNDEFVTLTGDPQVDLVSKLG